MDYIVSEKDNNYKIKIKDNKKLEKETIYTILFDGKEKKVNLAPVNKSGHMSLIIDNKSYDLTFDKEDNCYIISVNGETFQMEVVDERFKKEQKSEDIIKSGPLKIIAPMAGLVVSLEVKEGDIVSSGKGLIILEAMKMQNEIFSPGEGKVREIKIKAGDKVNCGDILMVLE